MRFAGGSSNTISRNYNRGIMSRLSKAVRERGYKYYDWNASVGDGSFDVTVEQQIENAMSYTADTLHLLAHDNRPQTIEAMKIIVPMMLYRGYEFKVIDFDTPEYTHGISN
jgi:hypothetical protein